MRRGHLERQHSLHDKISPASYQAGHRIISSKQDEYLVILKIQTDLHFSVHRPINRFILKHNHNLLRRKLIICELCMTSNPNVLQVPISLNQVWFLCNIKGDSLLAGSQEITSVSKSPLSELGKEAEHVLHLICNGGAVCYLETQLYPACPAAQG